MNRYKICVYAVSKNEEQLVDRWMDAVKEADFVVVTDTGSTDNTIDSLKARGAEVFSEIIDPWRLDTARNLALSHVPDDADICVSIDLDDIFEAGWREKLEKAWQPHHTRARYTVIWNSNCAKKDTKKYPVENIHCRYGFSWVHPVYEVLKYSGLQPDNTVLIPDLILKHFCSKPQNQNLPLLELSALENPDDDSVMFLLGREYYYCRLYSPCIETLTRFLAAPSASCNEERSAAMRYIASCHQDKGDKQNARLWLFRAIEECPGIREPYLQMARLGCLQRDWPLTLFMVDQALKITNKSGSYLFEPETFGYALYELGAVSSYRLGLIDKSLEYAKKAYELEPNDARLGKNLELIKLKIL